VTRRRGALAAALGALAALALAVPATAETRTPGNIAYRVSLGTGADGAVWRGSERVSFANTGRTPLRRVWLRLWDNGIAGCRHAPAMSVSNVTGGLAGPLSVACTARPVDLPHALPPGRRAALSFDLVIRIPQRDDRFGRLGPEILVGNAIPVLAIRDASGVHLSPYSNLGESFYSQIAHFDVTLATPDDMKVAATGVQQRAAHAGGLLVRRFVAPRVRDFAWAAGQLQTVEGTTSTGVLVRVSYPPAVSRDAAVHALAVARSAMARYAGLLGPYPYPEVDVVLGAFQTFGGMEYPGLVMSVAAEPPVAHELAHQWWYGLVGDDQYSAPWLDEAFATWTEGWFSGTNSSLCSTAEWRSAGDRVTANMGYWQLHPRDYGPSVYQEGACALQSLDELLGDSAFTALLGHYAREHRYGWSTTAEFEAAVQAADPGTDLRGFWAAHRIR
jgi:hypothetical protein